jgi:hypothetical protein
MIKSMKDVPWDRVAKGIALGTGLTCAWIGSRSLVAATFPESPRMVYAITSLVYWLLLFKYSINPIGEALAKRPGPD